MFNWALNGLKKKKKKSGFTKFGLGISFRVWKLRQFVGSRRSSYSLQIEVRKSKLSLLHSLSRHGNRLTEESPAQAVYLWNIGSSQPLLFLTSPFISFPPKFLAFPPFFSCPSARLLWKCEEFSLAICSFHLLSFS